MTKSVRQNRRVDSKAGWSISLWTKPWVQKCTAVTVFAVLAWVHFQLAHLLVSINVNNEQCKQCNPVKALPQQALLISNIVGNKTDLVIPVFTWDSIKDGNVHFNKARLDDKLLANLQRFHPDIPVTSQPIDFNIAGDKNNKVFIKISLRNLSTPINKLYFTSGLSSEDTYSEFKMMAEGLEPTIEISQISIDGNGSMNAANELKIGEWRYKLAGIPITILPESGTDTTFRFFSFENQNAENRENISAKSVGVSLMNQGVETFDSVLCGAPEKGKLLLIQATRLTQEGCPNTEKLAPLALSAFSFDKGILQITAYGNAWVQIKGEPITMNINALIKENPYLTALLAIFDAIAVTWLKRIFGQK